MTAPRNPKKKKIAFVTSGAAWGGVEQHLLDLLARLDPLRYEAAILSIARTDLYSPRLPLRSGVRVDVVTGLGRWNFHDYWRSFRAARAGVVVFECGEVGEFPWYAYLAAKLAGAARVVDFSHHMRDPGPKIPGDSVKNLARRLTGWRTRHVVSKRLAHWLSDMTACGSRAVKDNLLQIYGFRDEDVLVIPYGVDTNYFAPQVDGNAQHPLPDTAFDQRNGAKLFFCLTRLVEHKRVDVLLDALKFLHDKDMSVNCVIAGTGPLEAQLKTQRDRLGLTQSVCFPGFVEDVRPYFHAADLFVLPSDEEGFGIVLIEAMACGLPCVATDSGGPRDIITHGQDGWISERGSPERLAAVLFDVLADENALRQAGRRARQKVIERFSLERSMEEIERCLLA